MIKMVVLVYLGEERWRRLWWFKGGGGGIVKEEREMSGIGDEGVGLLCCFSAFQ